MKQLHILSFDSTAKAASVALSLYTQSDETLTDVYPDCKLLGLSTLDNGNTHSETLLPMAEEILNRFGFTTDDVDLFAVSAGPGSFTGVRIGVSTVKGLAFGTNKPCVGVSTLEALALNVCLPEIGENVIICPVMDARRNQVYSALFQFINGRLIRLTKDCAISLTELDTLLNQYPEDSKICLVGDGYTVARNGLTHTAKRLLVTPEMLIPQNAHSVARVALKAFLAGNAVSDRDLVPTYLRLSQAERERTERLQNENQ